MTAPLSQAEATDDSWLAKVARWQRKNPQLTLSFVALVFVALALTTDDRWIDGLGYAVAAGWVLLWARHRWSLPGIFGMAAGLAPITLGWLATEQLELSPGLAHLVALGVVVGIVAVEWSHDDRTRPALVPLLVVAQMTAGVDSPVVVGLALILALVFAVGGTTIAPIALVSVAAVVTPGLQGAAILLAAAAVLIAALDVDLAAFAALPGLVAVVIAADARGGQVWWVLAGAALVAVLLPAHIDVPRSIHRYQIPAAGLAAWLTIAPSTWSFANTTGLGPYSRGAPLAAAVGALVAVAVTTYSHRHPTT